MPDAAVSAPPAAPSAAPPAAPPSSAPPSSSPSVTFGDSKPAVETPKPEGGQPEASNDADLKFDFGFEGEAPVEMTPPEALGGEELDYSKPFDPELKELLKNSPEKLKAQQKAWYENRAWRSSGFKTPAEAQSHMQEVNSLAQSFGRGDGLQGLEAIRAEAQEWATVRAAFQAGDEGPVRQWFNDLEPSAAEKVVGHALKFYNEKNPQGWARTMAQTFMQELRAQNSAGESILTALNRLVQIAGDNKDVQGLLATVANQINEIDKISRQSPTAQPDQGFSERERQLQEKERGIFVKELSGRVMPQISTAAAKAASVVLGSRSIGTEAKKTFVTEIQNEYNRLTRSDSDFQGKARACLDNNDVEGFERLVRSQITRVMPTAAKNINRKYQGFTQSAATRKAEAESRVEGAAGGAVESSVVRYAGNMVQGGPDPSVIDWARMRQVAGSRKAAEEMMFDHKFFKKGDPKNTYYW